MKIKFFCVLAVLSCLFLPRLALAQQKPQPFGVQSGALLPYTSWKGTFLAVSDEESDGFQVWSIAAHRVLWKTDDFLMAFSRDEKTVMVAHSDEPLNGQLLSLDGVTLRLLDARTGHFLRRMNPLPPASADAEPDELLEYGFSPDASEFILATQHDLRLYNVRTGALRSTKKWLGLNDESPLTCAALTFDKKRLVAYDGGMVVLDAQTGAFIHRFPQFIAPLPNEDADVPASLEVSPDNYLFVEQFDEQNNSRAYRLSDGKLLWRTNDWPTFSLDGKLAYVPVPTGLDVLDAHTGHKLRHLSGPRDYGFDPAPDGDSLYEAREGKIYRWPTH